MKQDELTDRQSLNTRQRSRLPARQETAVQKLIPARCNSRIAGRQSIALTAVGHFRLIRSENCVLAALLTVLGTATAASHHRESLVRTLIASGVVFLVVASGNAINDYFDRDIDRLRRLPRPIPSGLVSPTTAVCVFAGFSFLAELVSFRLGAWAPLFVLSMILFAFMYSYRMKGIPLLGNASVAAQCGLTVLFGCGISGSLTSRAWFIAAVVSFGMLSFEVAKTIEDEVADNVIGYLRTVASVLRPGQQRLALLIVAILGVTAAMVVPCSSCGIGVRILALMPLVPLGVAARWRARDALSTVIRPFIYLSKVLWVPTLISLGVWVH